MDELTVLLGQPSGPWFDRGYLAVDPGHRLLVSPRLRQGFLNGVQSDPARQVWPAISGQDSKAATCPQ